MDLPRMMDTASAALSARLLGMPLDGALDAISLLMPAVTCLSANAPMRKVSSWDSVAWAGTTFFGPMTVCSQPNSTWLTRSAAAPSGPGPPGA